MTLHCPHCKQQIPDANISVRDRFAQCESCKSVFSLSELGQSEAARDEYSFNQRSAIPLPKGMNSSMDYDGLVITRRWFSFIAFFLIFFSIIWDGFMVIWVVSALNNAQYDMLAFSAIHIAVGIFLVYYTIALFVNTTKIKVGMQELKITHRPLPWKTPKPVSRTDARQFYGRRVVSRSSKGSSSVSYELRVQTSDGKDIKLLSGFQSREQILYVEQEIERYWGITDTRVAGEMD